MTEHGSDRHHAQGSFEMAVNSGPSDQTAPAAQAAGAVPAADAPTAHDPEVQARLAALAARREPAATAPPQGAPTPAAGSSPPRRAPSRAASSRAPSGRAPAGRASRLAMAGGAVGLSLGLVGAMAHASAEAQSPDPVPATTVQRVVVPTASQPAASQIIVVLPDQGDGSAIQIPASPVTVTSPTVPNRPAAPAPVVVQPEPVTESGGS